MTLAQLRYLLAIVEADLNITLAAERVHATQPGLSKQVRLLEEELGFRIFVRRGKSLERVSAAGAEVIERARVILAEADNIRTLAANQRGEAAGELTIATTQTQARFALPPALKLLKDRYPEVSVRLNFFANVERASSALQDADILVASAARPPETPHLVVPLYRWRRVAVVPKGHPLAQAERPLSLAQLAGYPLIGYESALGSHASVAAAFAKAGSAAQFAYSAHDIEVIKTYVRTGLGVGLLAEMANADDDLLRLPVTGLPVSHAYALVPRDRVVRDYVIDFLSNLAPHLTPRELIRGLHPKGVLPDRPAPQWREWRKETQAAPDSMAAA